MTDNLRHACIVILIKDCLFLSILFLVFLGE